MARYQPIERGGMLIPVMLHDQTPHTFEFALVSPSEFRRRFQSSAG
jgi:hypothetical protein